MRPLISFASFVLLLVATVCPLSASGAVLEPVEGKIAPGLQEKYAFFWVHEGAAIEATPKLGVLPKQLELVIDPKSRQPKFGIQSAGSISDRIFLLTLSAKFSFDQAEVDAAGKLLQANSSRYRGRPPVQIAVLQPSAVSSYLYVSDLRTGLKTYGLSDRVSSIPVDGTFALSVDLAKITGFDTSLVLAQPAVRIGLVSIMTVARPVGIPHQFEDRWDEVAKLVSSTRFVASDQLAAWLSASGKPRDLFAWLFGEPDILPQVRLILGDPRLEQVDGQIRYGWLMAREDIQGRVRSLVAGGSAKPKLRILQETFSASALLELEDICGRFADQILDLDTGKTGCGGRK